MAQKDATVLEHDGTQLSDDVDTDKLLVEIVQGLLMAHERLDRMEASLRRAVETATLEQQRLLTSNLTASVEHQNYSTGLLRTLIDAQTDSARMENAKQSENWKNLQVFLRDWQARLNKANTETIAEARSNTLKITENLNTVESRVQGTMTQLAHTNRRLLIWLIVLSAISLTSLGAIVYKLFIH